MNIGIFIELFRLGFKPVPLGWDEVTKTAITHTIKHGDITEENYTEETFLNWVKTVENCNGLALKLFAPFGCLDFDLKNTDDKTVFDMWMQAIRSIDNEILDKVAIERTRNGGYHVYFKYSKLTTKEGFARSADGKEVIALYTGGTLSYCDPTPGYNLIHNELRDVQDLTQDQYDIITSCAMYFDEYVPVTGKNASNILIDYPLEYENVCLQFDKQVTDEIFEVLVNDLGLFEVPNYRYNKKDKFLAYLRKGSKAKYSAKVYFRTKNLQIFSSSIAGFPHFGERKGKDDTSWNLSPTRIIYYKNDRDWSSTLDEIQLIADSAGLELVRPQQVTNLKPVPYDRLKFPYDVFPESIMNFIQCQPIQNEYLGGAALVAASVMIGNAATLKANYGYQVKPILYLAIVAPPGASKTPALKSMFKPLEELDSSAYKAYEKAQAAYVDGLAKFKNQPKGGDLKEPIKPILKQVLVKDSTIEMLVKILSLNTQGSCLVADELSGFLKRMNRYGESDEVQKWLELWSGSSILVQRISREPDKVENPFCSIIGGIQPGVLESLSTKDNEHNGFYHRFLFVYPEPQAKKMWGKYEIPEVVTTEMYQLFKDILKYRDTYREFEMTFEAEKLYAEWFDNKNRKYNYALNDNTKGIIAKYQDYCLRFALIIQILDNGKNPGLVVMPSSMERAIRLTEYFFGNMNKSMKILAPESPLDKLSGVTLEFYSALPNAFTTPVAIKIGEELKLKVNTIRSLLKRWSEKKDSMLEMTGETRSYVYTKIYN